MEFRIQEWTLLELYKKRNRINFPVYQRGEVWFEDKKKLLIDSVFKGLDIPKVYLQKINDEWDCIDGQQRIKTIWGFFGEEFETLEGDSFSALSNEMKRKFEMYRITITEITEIEEEEVRLLFTRLQLGLPLNSGEKLNAISSQIGEFVKKMVVTPFISNVSIPKRRFAKEQVCAQICNNSCFLNKTGDFRNSKYEDLEALYRTHKDFDLKSSGALNITKILEILFDIFKDDTVSIRNRAFIVSIYLFIESVYFEDEEEINVKFKDTFRKFMLTFIDSIKEEVDLGLDAKNRYLISFQSKIIQGADTKSSIRYRHECLKEAFEYYRKKAQIIGY